MANMLGSYLTTLGSYLTTLGSDVGALGGLLSFTCDLVVSGPSTCCRLAGSTLHDPEKEG
jgi:hypothetical protein